MRKLTKAQARKLRELAHEAYARELHEALRDLDSAFSDWRAGRIDGQELADFIHDFHDGTARDLYLKYNRLAPEHFVALSLISGLLRTDDVSAELRECLDQLVAFYRERGTPTP